MPNTSILFWLVIFGSIGLGFFVYGKKQKVIMPLICGVGLMVFPYFISSNLAAGNAGEPLTDAEPLQILNITPSGEDVPIGRRIIFQFNRPVVPLGRMERNASEIPISIVPELKGQWRWLNTSTLALQLDEASALSPATRHEILVSPGIAAEDGATLKEPVWHGFTTERPSVNDVWFKTWEGPATPDIRLSFNQPVARSSVEKHLFMSTSGEGRERIQLNVRPDPDTQETSDILPLPGENLALIVTPEQADLPATAPDVGSEKEELEGRRVWLVSPKEELPSDAPVELRVEPGISSTLGPESGLEDRMVTAFHTFPAFTFEGVEGVDNKNTEILIKPGETATRASGLNPLQSISLVFSSPVDHEQVKSHLSIQPDLAGGRTDYDPWAYHYSGSVLSSPHKKGRKYHIRLPGPLKAYQDYRLLFDFTQFRDAFGRPLAGPVETAFATDHRLPDFNLINPVTMLEKKADSDMPIVVTNLSNLTLSYDRLTAKGKEVSQKLEIPIPEVEDLAFRIPAQVRKMLGGKSGVVQGTVSSAPNITKEAEETWFFAEVTPFQVHVKLGHFNTLVWVMDLKTGKPISGASVKICKDRARDLSPQPEILTDGVTDSSGTVVLSGSEKIDPELSLAYPDQTEDPGLFVRVEKSQDLAWMPLDYRFQADSYGASRYSVWSEMHRIFGHIHAWGTTAQGVYRAGDTIQYKLYVRNQSNETFVPPPNKGYTLTVTDPMGKSVHEVKDLELSEFGASRGEFTIPKTGAVGWYQFKLSAAFLESTVEPMRVLVSDFTPSPFRVTTDVGGRLFKPGDRMEVTTQARLHAGGPYTDASTRITAKLTSRDFRSEDPSANGFLFDTYLPGNPTEQVVHQSEGSVDDRGDLITSFSVPDSTILFGDLLVESAVRDDRGKYITGRMSAAYSGRDRFVGLRSTAWVFTEDTPGTMEVLAVDAEGHPVAGVPVAVTLEHEETFAARVKGAGNAYLTEYTRKWVAVESQTFSSETGAHAFTFTPEASGLYRITAGIKDSKGREHSTQLTQWVVGKQSVVWEEGANNSLSIIPEKTSYRVGETARYLVQNPFAGARALITIERYGVLKHWVETLDSGTPVIEFKVEKDFIPGYFLSVVVMSPRVSEEPVSDDQVDLGKPAFRMGYLKTMVDDPYKELSITVNPEKATYKPGERVKVDLFAAPRQNENDQPIEFAVAVLDEAVFDLLAGGRDYFDPYKGFYTIDGLDVENFSLLLQLVGRQKFEKKGATPAGDGGAALGLRSVFKFVSYWNPSIIPDADGKATIEFTAPDNLTGWRVLAMAVTPGDRMGLGEGHFSVNRQTEIRPVMPNQVTEADTFQAGFSIMNRTSNTRDLKITITAAGAVLSAAGQTTVETTRSVTVAPYKRATVWLPLTAKGDGEIRFTAKAGDATDQDGVTHILEVHKQARLETSATSGSSVSTAVTEIIHFPDNIRTDIGGISLSLSPSILGQLESAFEYLRNYPYICWEQILTKSVMASHFQNLRKYIPDTFTWEGSDTLPQSMLDQAASYQAPNGGMAYYTPEDRYADPYLSAYTALSFNRLKESGFTVPSAVEEKLDDYLLTLLRKDVLPDFYSEGMASTVRAVALAALAGKGKIDLSDLKRYQPHLKEMELFGKAQFLLSAIGIAGAEDIRKEVFNLILAHADQSGGKFVLNEVIDDGYRRILSSPIRANAAVLSALIAYGRTAEGAALVGDIPSRLVRHITETRKTSGRWENTQENIFCMNALIDYSRVYESETPAMTVQAEMDKASLGETRFSDPRDAPVTFTKPVAADDPGRNATLSITRKGSGRLYYTMGLTYAPLTLKRDPVNAGIEIHREYSVERDGKWLLLKDPIAIGRGELVRVDLFLSLPAARNFVVVDDPLPGGLEPVNRDLATSSVVDADKGEFVPDGGSWWFNYSDWSSYGVSRWSFYHRELRHDSVRFYSEYLPAGNYHLSYTAQAIAPGNFTVMPTHAEEMYNPDLFGQGAPGELSVSLAQEEK